MFFIRESPKLITKFNIQCNVAIYGSPNKCCSLIRGISYTTPKYTNGNEENILNIRTKLTRKDKFRRIDKVSTDFALIYKAPLENTMAFSKHSATLTTAIVATITLVKYAQGIPIVDDLSDHQMLPTLISHSSDFYGFGCSFLVINFLILYVVLKYPLRIYKKKNDYIAIFEGNLPFTIKQFPFKKGDFAKSFHGFLPWGESLYKFNNKKIILLSNHFRTPSELHQMIRK